MYRATTPTHTFNVPFETEFIDALIITYQQKGKTIVEKTKDDVTFDEKKIIVTLTQEETNMFDKGDTAKVQLRVKIADRVQASNIITLRVNNVLNDEVM